MGLRRHTRHMALASALMCAVLTIAPLSTTADASVRSAAVGDDDPAVADLKAQLDAAEAAAASASRGALDASAAAERARLLAESTAARAQTLTARSADADATLASATARAGASASRLYRSTAGGPLVAQLLTAADPDSLLERLGILDRVSAVTARTASEARSASDLATSLRTQADAARAEAARLANEAATTAAEAQTRADSEATTVAATRTRLDELYAQLAAIRETTAAQERAARLAQQTAALAAQSAAATGGSSGGGATSSGSGGSSSGGSASSGSGASAGSGGGSGSTTAPAGPTMSPSAAREYARGAIGSYGWGDDQFSCLVSLWNRESGWRADALNPWSGAYGIPQALPGEKMVTAGVDWRTNAATQIDWGLSYIRSVYGSPCGAWAHSEATGWY